MYEGRDTEQAGMPKCIFVYHEARDFIYEQKPTQFTKQNQPVFGCCIILGFQVGRQFSSGQTVYLSSRNLTPEFVGFHSGKHTQWGL